MRRISLALTLLAFAAPPAYAQETNAPPGNSGVDEYLETVPGAGGNRPARPGGAPARRLPAQVRREVARSGGDAERLAAIAEATAPRGERDSRGSDGSSSPSRRDPGAEPAKAPTARSPLSAATDAVSGSQPGGMGMILPVLLITTAVLGAGVAVLRRTAG